MSIVSFLSKKHSKFKDLFEINNSSKNIWIMKLAEELNVDHSTFLGHSKIYGKD